MIDKQFMTGLSSHIAHTTSAASKRGLLHRKDGRVMQCAGIVIAGLCGAALASAVFFMVT